MFAALSALFIGATARPILKQHDYQILDSMRDQLHWTPGINPMFHGMSEEEFRGRLMTNIEPLASNVPLTRVTPLKALPKNYIFPIEHPECASPVEDQAGCGSCWAFSAVGAFSDRRCAALNTKTRFSPQYVVSCDPIDMGCDGGWLNVVSKYLQKTGTTTWECVDYFSGQGDAGKCMTTCDDGRTPINTNNLYTAKGFKNYGRNVTSMMTALAEQGPLQVAFTVYSDFMYYEGGIYHHAHGYQEGGHAVTAVGYGEENGVEYWTIRNSWGPKWGETADGKTRTDSMNNGGYFRMRKGNNECGIENEAWGATF